jgi:hypothetical protein
MNRRDQKAYFIAFGTRGAPEKNGVEQFGQRVGPEPEGRQPRARPVDARGGAPSGFYVSRPGFDGKLTDPRHPPTHPEMGYPKVAEPREIFRSL